MSVLVVGSVALDTIKTPLKKERNILGGSAVYFSLSASRFTPVNLVAVVGTDFPGRYLSVLKRRGIDLDGLEIKKGRTFNWSGEYSWDFSNPRTLATDLGVFADFNPEIPQKYKKSRYVFLANIDPGIQEKVLNQLKPSLVIADTMNYWIENKPKSLLKVLKRTDIFLLNETEARQLTGSKNMLEAARKIIELGPKIVIIKKGEHGSILFSRRFIFSSSAFLLESIADPTGAGDTFAGGFVGYLAKSGKLNPRVLRKAVVYGNIMATFAVEEFSVKRLASVSTADINKRLKSFRKLINF